MIMLDMAISSIFLWMIAVLGKQNMDIKHALCFQCVQFSALFPQFFNFFFPGGGVNLVITFLASSFLPLGSVF